MSTSDLISYSGLVKVTFGVREAFPNAKGGVNAILLANDAEQHDGLG